MKLTPFIILFLAQLTAWSQPIDVPSTWYSPQFKTITFLSDSTLEIEQGFFPDTAKCNQLSGLAHTFCVEENNQNGLFTQRQNFHYRFDGEYLILNNQFSAPSQSKYSLAFQQVGTNQIQLDFTNAEEYFPHRQHKIEDYTVTFIRLGSTKFSIPWDSLRFNSFKLYRNGDYRLDYSSTTSKAPHIAVKKGTLQPDVLSGINAHIADNPLIDAILPKDSTLWNTRSSYRQYLTPIPSDGGSFYFNLYQTGFHERFHGHKESFPKLIGDLFSEVNQVRDSLLKYIVQTDKKTIDVEDLNCLYWYRGNPIQREDIPYDWMPWGGLMQRKIYLLAEDVTVKKHQFDCVLLISQYHFSEEQISISQAKSQHMREGSEAHKKKVLNQIQKYFD
jgi:hypothetical protein